MARKGDDPMSGLLNNVGGIQAGLFDKPQSLRDMRTAPISSQKSPTPQTGGVQWAQSGSNAYGTVNQTQTPSPQSGSYNNHGQKPKPSPSQSNITPYSSGSSKPSPSKQAQNPYQGSSQSLSGMGAREADKKLSEMLGDGLSLKTHRPMREVEKPVPQRTNVYASASSSQPSAVQGGASNFHQDDLDNVFGQRKSTPAQTSLQPTGDDPFALFGGLGTTQQAKQSPKAVYADDGLLGDFPGPTGPSPQHVRVSSQVASPISARNSQKSMVGSDDWGSMWDAEGLVSPVGSVTSYKANVSLSGDSFRDQQKTSEKDLRHLSSSSLPDVPPPPYDSVVSQKKVESPRTKIGSPKSKGVVSPRSLRRDGSNAYQSFRDEVEQPGGHFPPQRQKIPAHIKEHRQQQQSREHDMKEQAKQWLSAGKGWLSDASKKVAQAVKETQAQINNKIDELDNRQGGPVPHRGRKNPGAKSREKAESPADIPKYYYEWAETIAALPTPEQVNTLAAMPEDDARTINKILRQNSSQNSRRSSMDATEESILAEAKRRSLSTTNASGPSGTLGSQTLPSVPSLPETRASGRPHSASPVSSLPPQTLSQPGRKNSQNMGARAGSSSQLSSQGSLNEQGGFVQPKQSTPEKRPQAPPTQQTKTPESHDLMGFGGAQVLKAQDSRPKAKERDEYEDLMGLGGANQAQNRASSPPTGSAQESADLMGFMSAKTQTQEPAGQSADFLSDTEDNPFVESLSVKPNRPGHPPPSNHQANDHMDPGMAELFGHKPQSQPAQRQGGRDSMIDFGDEAGPIPAEHSSIYKASVQDEEQEGEPEERKIARKKRLAAQHARMQKQLTEKQARDKAEEEKQDAQHDLRLAHRERMEAWKSGKKDNIRALLSTLHTVLWEGSGWTAPGMTDLVEVNKVKKCYMKANLVVHPDKVKQKGGTVEQIVIADMAFDTLKIAWNKFESTELKR